MLRPTSTGCVTPFGHHCDCTWSRYYTVSAERADCLRVGVTANGDNDSNAGSDDNQKRA